MDDELRADKANQAALDFLEIVRAHDLSPPEVMMAVMQFIAAIIISAAPDEARKRVMVDVAIPEMIRAFVDGGDISSDVLDKVMAEVSR